MTQNMRHQKIFRAAPGTPATEHTPKTPRHKWALSIAPQRFARFHASRKCKNM
jgi:hypothetical protein